MVKIGFGLGMKIITVGKTYTNEGELVLDNTAGSGTTAIACLNTNRQFIVMEKERSEYCRWWGIKPQKLN